MRDKVFVIILNFRSGRYLSRCISSVLKSSSSLVQVIVVDNASKDNSLGDIKTRFRKVNIITNSKNLGFSGGNNVGIRLALKNNPDYVFILNPDTTINKKTIIGLLSMMKSDMNVGIVGPKIYSPGGKTWSCGGEVDKNRFTGGLIGFGKRNCSQCNTDREVDFVSGTAMFVRRRVFENIGLLPEEYFLYYEDVDFCLRARRAGFKICFTPNSTLCHYWSSSVGKTSPMKNYYMARNHLLFTRKYAPMFVKIREFFRMPKTVYEHYRRGEKFALLGIRDYFLRRFGKCDYWN